MQNFRRFHSATQAIDEAWSTSAVSEEKWTLTGIDWRTNNGPVQIINEAGLKAVCKPIVPSPTNPHTAATEKIAADLAFQLQLPVPPAILWLPNFTESPRWMSVSAWAHDPVLTWAQATIALTTNQRLELIPAMSAMVPFETWISAQDRHNPGNMLVGFDQEERPIGSWIDYAFSLEHSWRGNLMGSAIVAPSYPPVGPPDGRAMAATAAAIAALEDNVIECIINRIPTECLPQPVAENICRNLKVRRESVKHLF